MHAQTCVSYPIRTCLQCTLENREQFPQFIQLLATLQENGFYGIELNLPELNIIKPSELVELLSKFHLKLDMLATGVYAKTHGFSLSDPHEGRRLAAVEGCRKNLEYAAQAGCGIIIGFFKGGPHQDKNSAEQLLLSSLQLLKPAIESLQVLTLLEATNRKESSVACTLEETIELAEQVHCPYVQVLADTYHINIEEAPVTQTLAQFEGRFSRLHLSDDNRAFPGLGSLDFSEIYRQLFQSNFKGIVGIEGNIQISQMEDTVQSSRYLYQAIQQAQLRLAN